MARVEEIARKILDNDLYGGALTWNLRTGEVETEYDELNRMLVIKNGRPTIPDSNHRHQGIFKAVQRAREIGLDFDEVGYEFPLIIEGLGPQGVNLACSTNITNSANLRTQPVAATSTKRRCTT